MGKTKGDAYTKALLLGVVARTVHAHDKEASLQTVRSDGWTWNRILCELASQPCIAKHHVSQGPSQLDTIVSSPDSDSCSISSSSSNFSTPVDFAWFRLARGVAHLVNEHDKVAPIPWCRQTPFQHASFEWGTGVDSCLNICAHCLACVPSHMSRAIRSLRQDLLISRYCFFSCLFSSLLVCCPCLSRHVELRRAEEEKSGPGVLGVTIGFSAHLSSFVAIGPLSIRRQHLREPVFLLSFQIRVKFPFRTVQAVLQVAIFDTDFIHAHTHTHTHTCYSSGRTRHEADYQ